ncbi:uncharacterized protein LOC121102934 [Ursus maritimus]|uniref:Uncharacterized protein LOC121102934 n=1 Tax=Ursus maritimus TaxID=29073 RepID=A0A8M1G4M5_URSMA|nr:uncharacterized protein LOC121102934 [Ursus maritimus]
MRQSLFLWTVVLPLGDPKKSLTRPVGFFSSKQSPPPRDSTTHRTSVNVRPLHPDRSSGLSQRHDSRKPQAPAPNSWRWSDWVWARLPQRPGYSPHTVTRAPGLYRVLGSQVLTPFPTLRLSFGRRIHSTTCPFPEPCPPATLSLLYFLGLLLVSEIIWHLSFSDLLKLIMPSRSIHVVTNGHSSSFFMAESLAASAETPSPFVSLGERWAACVPCLLDIPLQRMSTCTCIFQIGVFISFGSRRSGLLAEDHNLPSPASTSSV